MNINRIQQYYYNTWSILIVPRRQALIHWRSLAYLLNHHSDIWEYIFIVGGQFVKIES